MEIHQSTFQVMSLVYRNALSLKREKKLCVYSGSQFINTFLMQKTPEQKSLSFTQFCFFCFFCLPQVSDLNDDHSGLTSGPSFDECSPSGRFPTPSHHHASAPDPAQLDRARQPRGSTAEGENMAKLQAPMEAPTTSRHLTV